MNNIIMFAMVLSVFAGRIDLMENGIANRFFTELIAQNNELDYTYECTIDGSIITADITCGGNGKKEFKYMRNIISNKNDEMVSLMNTYGLDTINFTMVTSKGELIYEYEYAIGEYCNDVSITVNSDYINK